MAGVPDKTSFFLSKPLFSKLGKINGKARLEIQFSGSVFLKITLEAACVGHGTWVEVGHLSAAASLLSSCLEAGPLLFLPKC